MLGGFNWSHEFNSQWKIQHRAYVQTTKEDDQVVLLLALQADNETGLLFCRLPGQQAQDLHDQSRPDRAF